MSKTRFESSIDLTQEIVRAKAEIIASLSNAETKEQLMNEHLNDEVITETYNKIYQAVHASS